MIMNQIHEKIYTFIQEKDLKIIIWRADAIFVPKTIN